MTTKPVFYVNPDDIPEGLTVPQTKALTVLVTTSDRVQAAKAAGVSPQTVNRWIREDAAFKGAIEAATRASLQEFSLALSRLAQKAAKALEDALDPSVSIGYRLRAADTVANRLLAIRSMVELEDKVAELEEQLSKQA